MTSMFRTTIAAALLAGAAFTPALAIDTPAADPDATSIQAGTSNNAQAGVRDIGSNVAPNTQMAANMTANNSMGISSERSPTERKAAHMTRAQERRANANEARTTRQLNQQAAAAAAPGANSVQ